MALDAQVSGHVDAWRRDSQNGSSVITVVLLGKHVRVQEGGSNRQA